MSWITQNPLNIAPGGDGKQTGFTKIKNEFISLYLLISGLFAVDGHAHTGNGSDGELIDADSLNVIPIPASIAQGDIIYRGASAFERLPAGTTGQILKTNGSASNPEWVTNSIGGEILQLKIINNATTPNAKMDITSNNVLLYDANYISKNSGVISLTADLGASGANGLDTGTKANSTSYFLFVIEKEDGTKAGLWSLSSTSPTMPTDYIYKRRVGYNHTDSSGNIYRVIQRGKRAQYVVSATTNTAKMPIIASGTAGSSATPTWVPVAVNPFVPTTAISIIGSLFIAFLGGAAIVSPNNNYGTFNNTSNLSAVSSSSGTATTAGVSQFNFVLESTNIYWASAGNAVLTCLGWEDAI